MVQSIRVLVVDDFEPFRRLVATMLRERPEFQIIYEASDGQEAVEKTCELQPDLVILDIGLPKLNGIQVAEAISSSAPKTKVLFLSENRSRDIVREAVHRAGAYVLKSSARKDLIQALEAVLQGKRFVSASVNGDHLAL